MRTPLLLVAAVLLLGGCDPSGGDTTVSGRVVDSRTGTPVAGVIASLHFPSSGIGIDPTVDATTSGVQGEFSLSTSGKSNGQFHLHVNYLQYGQEGPVDGRYEGYFVSVRAGRANRVTAELDPKD